MEYIGHSVQNFSSSKYKTQNFTQISKITSDHAGKMHFKKDIALE
jgi:hypothetical protein